MLADADLDLAVKAIVASRVINTGQVCNCAERVYVERKVADAFVDKVGPGHGRDPLRRPVDNRPTWTWAR